jgi:hypothetical protein
MTGTGLLGELAAWTGLAAPPPASTHAPAPAAATGVLDGVVDRSRIAGILDVADRVLGESSRREHVFDWLQPSGAGDPVTVEAYYPGRRLVVLTEEQPEPDYSLSTQLIPAHGLKLFRITLADFRADSGTGFSRLLGELKLVAAATATGAPAPAAPTATVFQPPPAPAPPIAAVFQPPPAPAPPIPAVFQPLPAEPTPLPPAPVRQSAFGSLMGAVQRYTAAPQPFVLPAEPTAAPVDPGPAPAAGSARAAAEPAAAAVSPALQRYLTAPQAAQAAPPPPEPATSPVASRPFVPAPLPFALTAPPPLPPELEQLLAVPQPELRRHRVGQHQAEAAARAARFVEARAAGSLASNGGHAAPKPAPTPVPRPDPALWRNEAVSSPFGVPGLAPVISPDLGPLTPSAARARAIERALAKGRALPDPHPRAPAHSEIDPDDVPLGFLVISIGLVELILAVVLIAVSGGLVVLGLGLALDAAARVLGTLAVARSGREWGSGWRWMCGLAGSPGVIWFAFQRDRSLLGTGPVPEAGPVAAVALFVLLVGLAGLPAGI